MSWGRGVVTHICRGGDYRIQCRGLELVITGGHDITCSLNQCSVAHSLNASYNRQQPESASEGSAIFFFYPGPTPTLPRAAGVAKRLQPGASPPWAGPAPGGALPGKKVAEEP